MSAIFGRRTEKARNGNFGLSRCELRYEPEALEREAYCTEQCRRAGYPRCKRRRQRRYRRTEKGKKTHSLDENRRRHPELYPDSKNMDDGTSKRRSTICFSPSLPFLRSIRRNRGPISEANLKKTSSPLKKRRKIREECDEKTIYRQRIVQAAQLDTDRQVDIGQSEDRVENQRGMVQIPLSDLRRVRHRSQSQDQSGQMLSLPQKLQYHRHGNGGRGP